MPAKEKRFLMEFQVAKKKNISYNIRR